MRRRVSGAPPIERVAGIAQRLAVLLAAGVPPAAAWTYLAEMPVDSGGAGRDGTAIAASVVPSVATAAEHGNDVAEAIARASGSAGASARRDDVARERTRSRSRLRKKRDVKEGAGEASTRQAWAALAAAWFVATDAGAPLAASLRVLADSFRAIAQAERDIQVALAGPRATAKVVIALPIVGILFGLGMGFDTLHVLFATAPGIACLGAGAALLFAGARWNRALVARARPRDTAPGLTLDLLAVAMSGGVSVERARELVTEAKSRFSVDAPTAASSAADGDAVLALAVRAGVPAAELLRSEADQRRREARSRSQHDASTLAVTLMLPLGCCVLPSFLILGVAPVLLALVSSTIGVIA